MSRLGQIGHDGPIHNRLFSGCLDAVIKAVLTAIKAIFIVGLQPMKADRKEMNMAIALVNQNSRTRQEWAEIINADWRKSIEGIIQTGQDLASAKAELPHGEFLNMVRDDLDFSPCTADNLMAIARHPAIGNSARGHNLPVRWTVLRQIAKLGEEDFYWAQERGLISSDMSRGAADAIRSVRKPDKGDEIVGAGKTQRDLPTPSEARNIARETNRFVAASDGNIYSGATEEEGEAYAAARSQTFGLVKAINTIADCVPPEKWLADARDHQIHDFRFGSIDDAIDWLTQLKPLMAKKMGITDAE